ncbi:MAG: multiheme c-type cytochrome [Desulfobulbia bacterium]
MKKFLFATSALALLFGATQAQAVVLPAHAGITSYNGPATCIACHPTQASGMLNSLHMQWAGKTPELTNAPNQTLGKAVKGINTFCTYAMSSGGACFNCHVRADGNAPHAPSLNDVDCLMCHNDTYQRKTTPDPTTAMTITDYLGKIKTYIFGLQDAQGNYFTEPDYALMPAGTTMVDLAKNVHNPTRKSCLRCHAKAGGGDWTKRGDMGVNTAAPTDAQDVHMSPTRGNLTCADCHAVSGHKISGRGIDLRQTEAPDPKCQDCHGSTPHSNSKLNRHATGQVACQTCHIKTFAKGGATEMSRDWLTPVWNPTFCNGQGGYVGHEVKVANVKPEYRWFDGTSYVYNVGEKISPNADGTYTMARANGKIFDGKSKIVPIKNHKTNIPLLADGRIVPPAIMWMFMTGDFNQAVQKGMQDQGMTGSYTMVNANAEMLITHGVDPKSMAPKCAECHGTYSGHSNLMIPFTALGYHTLPAKVKDCTLCHERESSGFESVHDRHVRSERLKCDMCHTTTPVGLIKPSSDLCNDCHSSKSTRDTQKIHKKHTEKGYTCKTCHKF